MLLAMSKYEKELFEQQRQQCIAANSRSIKQQIRDYPGRIVSIVTAEQRMRYQNISLHDACVMPVGSFKVGGGQ